MKRTVLILIPFLIVTACSNPKTVSISVLVPLQTSSSFHPLFYIGSDDSYHYFQWLNLKYEESYRVRKSEYTLIEGEFPLRTKNASVVLPGSLESRRIKHLLKEPIQPPQTTTGRSAPGRV